jgi:hypothetical protein
MPIAQAIATLNAKSAQSDSLIANAHRLDAAGVPIFSLLDREQITVASFLNLFVAWEEFLESTMSNFLVGAASLSGRMPLRYASPPTVEVARRMLIGTGRYFDYANHTNFRNMALLFFQGGHPFEPHISAIFTDLSDLKTMRNSSAHMSSTTQSALEALAQRILGLPQPGITLYSMLTSIDPRSAAGSTVLAEARDKLLATAGLIANG